MEWSVTNNAIFLHAIFQKAKVLHVTNDCYEVNGNNGHLFEQQ